MRQIFKVYASGGDVRGNNDFHLAGTGAAHHAVSSRLVESAMQSFNAVTSRSERFGQIVNFIACARKDDGKLGVFQVENAAKRSNAKILPTT